ncbi:MAG TPA: thioredoxin domain-containing protein [Longimicrobiales bacterium]|nr:thioredoxin domain-containing protein [Longimicrobiales bacterium]
MTYRLAWSLVLAVAVAACSGGDGDAGARSGSSGVDGLSAELLGSREQLAQDDTRRMSAAAPAQDAISDFLNEHLPIERVDLDTLGFDFGEEDAPVQVLEFSDFGCGYCRQFHLETFPTLREEYVETGKVRWKYVPMLLGIFPNAIEAAQVGECVGEQGLFTEVSDALFERQSEWKRAGGDPMPVLLDIVEEAGGDPAAAEACVAENRHASRIASGTAFFANSGGRGTPTFFIAGLGQPIPGAVPVDLFRQVLDTVYATLTRPMPPAADTAGN